ncbi:MAG TPA: SUMF1/EgtB/PvdO family nonheme iron enzyme, partial [Anaerolineales bacterium]
MEEDFVYVDAGPFYMGSTEEEPLARDDEMPLHLVRMDGYWIWQREVSNTQYKDCVDAGVCTPPIDLGEGPSSYYNDPEFQNHPVVGVNWFQAAEYCEWRDARLPTEAEWEKTARGEFGQPFPWGEDEPNCDLNNMVGCFNQDPFTENIGQYPDGESEYEALDMAGNVWEWVSDWYAPDYYQYSPTVNPPGPGEGEYRVIRGGSYDAQEIDLRAAARLSGLPEDEFNNVGFRCVPLGLGSPAAAHAPFCQDTYTSYCRPPGDGEECEDPGVGTSDGGEEDDTPGQSSGLRFGALSCPDGSTNSFTLFVDDAASTNYEVTIDNEPVNCVVDPAYPDRLYCTGPAQTPLTSARIDVCPGEGGSSTAQIQGISPVAAPDTNPRIQGFTPVTNTPDVTLVGFQLPSGTGKTTGAPPLQGVSTTSGLDGYCPQGFYYDTQTGNCERSDGENCQEGWTYNPQSYRCEPDDGGACPEGTTYSTEIEACVPENGGECPDGYYFDPQTESCEPPGNYDGGGACPAGYFYDVNIHCCSPITTTTTTENGCQDGYYYDYELQRCMPTDDYGCGPNLTYNPYEGGCV